MLPSGTIVPSGQHFGGPPPTADNINILFPKLHIMQHMQWRIPMQVVNVVALRLLLHDIR